MPLRYIGKFPLAVVLAAFAGTPALAQASTMTASDCEALAGLDLAPGQIGLPTGGGAVESAQWNSSDEHGTYCQVNGALDPVDPDSWPILWQVNLPEHWNRKAIQFGGGGYNGTIPRTLVQVQHGLSTAPAPIAQGYITFGDDSGHPPEADGGAAFARNEEALVNYGYAHIKKALDVMTLLAEEAYGAVPERVYFSGGSTGGREGLTAAMRWPEAYDGIIAYYPTADFMGLRLWGVALADAIYREDSAGWIPPELVETISQRAIALCDSLDGVEDGLVSDAAGCREISAAIIEELRCAEGEEDSPGCLNDIQIDRTIAVYHEGYALPYELSPGISDYPGYNSLEGVLMNVGTEPGFLIPPPSGPNAHHVNRAYQFMSNFVDTSEDFDLLAFDIQNPGVFQDRLVELSSILGATDADLGAFAERGGKIIWVQGTEDPSVSPWGNVAGYQRIVDFLGADVAREFMRFYMLPGLAHGSGTFSPEWDSLSALDNWVETGVPPSGLIMVDSTTGATRGRTRPICEYPAWPKYNGTGDIDDHRNFHCATQ